ncbi:Serine protease 27 (Marapsin) (Pancreasin) [Durusdinium trenchii]
MIGRVCHSFCSLLLLLNLPVCSGSSPGLRGQKADKPREQDGVDATCGRVGWHSTKRQNRIVHGQDSKQCAWKWQVSLRAMINGTAQHFCGGTLISEKWILTAAHCTAFLNDCKMSKMQVVAGGWHQKMENNTDGGIVTRGVRRVLIHPSFNVESHFSMDFGLLELDAPVPFDDCVGSVCLPTKDFPTVGTNCEVTGWGTLNMEGAVPNVLQQGLVNTVSQDICAEQYAKDNQTITSGMLCATGATGQGVTDACQGDSGGPLVCLEGERFVIAGVISWGHGCGDANYPGVYARVASGLEWIEAVLSGKIAMPEEPSSSEVNFHGHMWAVVSGRCSIDEDGCVRSPGYPDQYGGREKCRIAVDTSAAMPITVDHFATEAPYDHLEVNCVPYSGKKGPHGIIPNSDIFWLADGSMQDSCVS